MPTERPVFQLLASNPNLEGPGGLEQSRAQQGHQNLRTSGTQRPRAQLPHLLHEPSGQLSKDFLKQLRMETMTAPGQLKREMPSEQEPDKTWRQK